MKKLIYGIGAIAAIVTPVVAVVSCGKKSEETLTLDIAKQKAADLQVKYVGKVSDHDHADKLKKITDHEKWKTLTDHKEILYAVQNLARDSKAVVDFLKAQGKGTNLTTNFVNLSIVAGTPAPVEGVEVKDGHTFVEGIVAWRYVALNASTAHPATNTFDTKTLIDKLEAERTEVLKYNESSVEGYLDDHTHPNWNNQVRVNQLACDILNALKLAEHLGK